MDTMVSPAADPRPTPADPLPAPAKINLRLEVLGKRPDGYHAIRSLAVTVGLCDRILLEPGPSDQIDLICDHPGLCSPEDNLAIRAARLLQERTGVRAGARIRLTKSIPIGAGLGGGSSDAAATLAGLDRMWQTRLSVEELKAIGAEIGSDVPLFFHAPAAWIEDRGESVRSVRLRWSGSVLLMFADVPVSTAEVYAAWRPEDRRPSPLDWRERLLDAESAASLAPLLGNDLEAAVLRVCPALREAYALAGRVAGRAVCISGAGSTFFALFDDVESARAAAEQAAPAGLRAVVVGAGEDRSGGSPA